MSYNHSPKLDDSLSSLKEELIRNNQIKLDDYHRYDVKRGLRNSDGTGVMAGLSRICSVEGYYIDDGERVPKEGKLIYRGINMTDIVRNCQKENRFGYEEVVWLLLLGDLPTQEQLDKFRAVLAEARELPDEFIEDMIMKAPSPNIMNKVARSVLALYSYDNNPDDLSIENVLRQSIKLIAQIPTIMSYAYQVKRRAYDHKSMYIHQNDKALSTAESILHTIRSDRKFTDEEAKILDLCMIIHADHGGGNNSTFTTRCITSTGTDTYSAIAAGIGSLKGPKHGGANIQVHNMIADLKKTVSNPTDEGQVADYLTKVIHKEAGDRTGLIYGMGHAVYSLSDPRERVFKGFVEQLANAKGRAEDMALYNNIERIAPMLIAKERKIFKGVSPNVDFYSGFVYDMLDIPKELYTPLFAIARIVGWSAHRIEELVTTDKIIRPAYKSLVTKREYVDRSHRD